MDLDPTDEQRMLADTVDGLLVKNYDPNARLALLSSRDGWSRELWHRYAELGLLGLAIDEQHGGAGMGAAELAVVCEVFGRHLVLEPYLSTVVLGAQLVAAAGTPQQRAAVLPGVADGSMLLALAHTEPGSAWSPAQLSTTATQAGDQWTLSGQKVAVVGGDSAHRLVVTARTPDDALGLFLVDASDLGLRRAGYAMQDGQRGADLVLAGTPAQALSDVGDARAALDAVLDVAAAALCAEAVGAMDRMLWITVDYLKTRVQFGRPIATFQALQHRAADMYVSLEQARSLALVARLALADGDTATRRTTVRAAKLGVDAAARHVGEETVQLHGGIAMTMEYPAGHYLKRTAVIAQTLAGADELVEQIGRAGGLIPAADE